jgi:uncharacterized protein YehS (DUF1456 family)
MTNNDILRRLRYTFNFTNQQMVDIFALGNLEVTEDQVLIWFKREEDKDYKSCRDKTLAHYLNGLIVFKRGKKEDDKPVPVEDELNNNIILRKLKIAMNMQSDDMIKVLETADFRIGKSELSAFFRKPGHKHYRVCKDQVLRNFIAGLQNLPKT